VPTYTRSGSCGIAVLAGILEREQEQSVVYGSIDFGKTIVTHDKYKELVRSRFSWIAFHLKLERLENLSISLVTLRLQQWIELLK
jgi:hypothetical protein